MPGRSKLLNDVVGGSPMHRIYSEYAWNSVATVCEIGRITQHRSEMFL